MSDYTQPSPPRPERTRPVRVTSRRRRRKKQSKSSASISLAWMPIPRGLSRRLERFVNRHTSRAVLVGAGVGLALVVLIGLIGIASFYGYYQVFNRIVPGVRVADVPLGGSDVNQAALTLHQTWNVDRGLIITDGDRSWYAPPSQFGISLDTVATAQAALDVGHASDPITEFIDLFDSTFNGRAVEPIVRIDSEAARAGLETLSGTINLAPQDATIDISNGQVVALPGKPGYELDVEGTLAVLVADPGAALLDGYLPLVLTPIAPRVTDVGNAAAQAEAMLAFPLVIKGYDPVTDEHIDWSASREQIAGWLAVVQSDSGPTVVVSEDRLAATINEFSNQLGSGRSLDAAASAQAIQFALENRTDGASLIVTHAPTTYTVQPGDTLTSIAWDTGIVFWRILDANPGIEADTLSVGQTINIPSKDDQLGLPVVVNKRIVVSITDQRLWAYQDGALLYEFVISTGIDRSPTQPGIFQVEDHDLSAYASLWDLTMPHFISIYESWPGFYNGFHGLPTLSNGQILWADILGKPASFGCIILDLDDAETLYNWADEGVVVEIVE